MQKIWITKYALSSGIKVVDAEVDQDRSMATYRDNAWNQYVHGDDFHFTPEGAALKAEDMRLKKIASLQKQIRRLESMCFDPTDGQE